MVLKTKTAVNFVLAAGVLPLNMKNSLFMLLIFGICGSMCDFTDFPGLLYDRKMVVRRLGTLINILRSLSLAQSFLKVPKRQFGGARTKVLNTDLYFRFKFQFY